jgi:hypothetical protein
MSLDMHTFFEIKTEYGWEPCGGYLSLDRRMTYIWVDCRFANRGWPKDAALDSQLEYETWKTHGCCEYPTYMTLPEVTTVIHEQINAHLRQYYLECEDGESDKSRRNNHTAGSETTVLPVPVFKSGDIRVLIFFD